MKNHQFQTNRHPASTSDVLPPIQRYAPACRAETPAPSESRITHPSSEVLLTKEDHELLASPPNHQLSTNHHQPIRRTRNGKIARLPHPFRDMVNRMLRN